MNGTPLLCWSDRKDDIEVVGVYAGNNKYIHLTEPLLNRLREKLTKVSA